MRVALIADFLEERWPSMDLVAEMLALHLPRAASASRPVEVRLIRPAMKLRFGADPSGLPTGRFRQTTWMLDRLLNRFIDYPRFLRGHGDAFDLFHLADHSYSQLVHDLPAGRTVVTCHDLDTFRCLGDPAERRSAAFRAMTRRILSGLQKAAHVVCVSEATRNELLERNWLPEVRVSVVRSGLRPNFDQPPEPAAVKRLAARLEDHRPGGATVDLLHVGSTIPRKRLDVLLEVFARIKRDVEPGARLLRVGGEFTPGQQRQVERLGLAESICVLPFLTPAELAAAYSRAALLLFPSEAEGFGLPVIEALAGGTPVIASDLPVLHEVGGNAAEYVPVADVAAWTERTRDLLAERKDDPARWLIRQEAARRQASKFSWAETSAQVLKIYDDVLAQAPPVGRK
jgi:glycosyltransferase involved in cell wall biosynthesis